MVTKELSKSEIEKLKDLSKNSDIGTEYGINYRGKSISGTITIEKLIAKGFAKTKTSWESSSRVDRAFITPAGLRAIGCKHAEDEIVIESSDTLNDAQISMLRRLVTSQEIKRGALNLVNTARKLVRMGLVTERDTGKSKTIWFSLTAEGEKRRAALPMVMPTAPVMPIIVPQIDVEELKVKLSKLVQMLTLAQEVYGDSSMTLHIKWDMERMDRKILDAEVK